MASPEQVKEYLAYWFQLGKGVVLPNRQAKLLPHPVLTGSGYSSEFEGCWQQILSEGDCYLEGTEQTVQQLLTPLWEIANCSRCAMPAPASCGGIPLALCPCHDLPSWPNRELPLPRAPVDSSVHLNRIRERLQGKGDGN